MAPSLQTPRSDPRAESSPTGRRGWIPVRSCSRCEAVEDVFHLTMVGRLWLCQDCHRKMHFDRATEPRSGSVDRVLPTPDGIHRAFVGDMDRHSAPSNPNSIHARLARIDTVFRWITTGLRILVYVLLIALASAHPIVENVLFGFFIADVCVWVLRAWSDARFHGHAITAEAVFYSILFITLYATGRLDLPSEYSARYLAAGTAGLTLLGQAARFWQKLHFV